MNPNGEYIVFYKCPNSSKRTYNHLVDFNRFDGKCDNFTPTGLCAFSNNKEEILLVHYLDIVQMKPKD